MEDTTIDIVLRRMVAGGAKFRAHRKLVNDTSFRTQEQLLNRGLKEQRIFSPIGERGPVRVEGAMRVCAWCMTKSNEADRCVRIVYVQHRKDLDNLPKGTVIYCGPHGDPPKPKVHTSLFAVRVLLTTTFQTGATDVEYVHLDTLMLQGFGPRTVVKGDRCEVDVLYLVVAGTQEIVRVRRFVQRWPF